MFDGIKMLPYYLAGEIIDPYKPRRNLDIPEPPYECEQEDHFKDSQGYCKMCHEINTWASKECCLEIYDDDVFDETSLCCFSPDSEDLYVPSISSEGVETFDGYVPLNSLICGSTCEIILPPSYDDDAPI